MKVFYDESILRDGSDFQAVKDEKIYTSNSVDKSLLERLGFNTTEICSDSNTSLYPVNPCVKINVCSLNKKYTDSNYMYTHNLVHVFRNCVKDNVQFTVKSLEIVHPNVNLVYDVNDNMTSMEMTILIKYYSFTVASGAIVPINIEGSGKITATRYHTLQEWLKTDEHVWFSFDLSNFIIKSHIGQNTRNGVLITKPPYMPTLQDHSIC